MGLAIWKMAAVILERAADEKSQRAMREHDAFWELPGPGILAMRM